ncbi:MAG: hypothetical protein ACYC0H_09680, partial [Solirubrobacteraceae bacterium]
MKSIRYVGLLAAAVSALVMATGASAAFASEWKLESGQSFPVTVTGKGGKATFESEKGNKVTSNESKSTGELTSATKGTAKVTYSGSCKLEGTIKASCPTIETKALEVEPLSKLNGGTKTGADYRPASGTEMAKFTCGETEITVTGSVICVSEPVELFETDGEVICKQTS